jgi:hypothetical protein
VRQPEVLDGVQVFSRGAALRIHGGRGRNLEVPIGSAREERKAGTVLALPALRAVLHDCL